MDSVCYAAFFRYGDGLHIVPRPFWYWTLRMNASFIYVHSDNTCEVSTAGCSMPAVIALVLESWWQASKNNESSCIACVCFHTCGFQIYVTMSVMIRCHFGSRFWFTYCSFPLRRRTESCMSGKRRKTTDERYHALISLGRSSFVTKSGIEQLLSEVKKNELPDAFDRRSQYRARKHPQRYLFKTS